MLFFVIAVLGTTALAEVRVYEFEKGSLDGFFVETEEQAMFKRLGHLKMLKENFLFLYPLPNKPTEWRMGYGRNKDDIKDAFKASGKENEPPTKKVWKNTRGKLKSYTLEKRLSLSSTLKETEANGGSTTLDGGVICLEEDSDKWIMLAKDDPKMCDHNKDCREAWDENCPNEDSTVERDQYESTEQGTEPEQITEAQEEITESSAISDTNIKPIHTEPGKETFDPQPVAQVNCKSDNENIVYSNLRLFGPA